MALTAYITATPLDSGKFKDIYSSIREFKSRFKERFELDHYMGGVVDDTDPTCEGYHKQITMNGGEYNATNIPTTIPACPTGGIVFFSIGGELCCYDGNTAYQMTDGGHKAYNEVVDITSDITGYLLNCYYGNGLYIIVGHDGKLYTSSDGETWTIRNSNTSVPLLGASYGAGLYVIVGHYGVIITSSDGETWTSRTSGTSANLYGVGFGNNLFVAVGAGGVIRTSPDGITWTGRTSGTTNDLYDCQYGNGLYVATGKNNIRTSTDGVTWTDRTPGTPIFNVMTCVYANGLYVAVGGNGVIITSSDGETWTSRTSGTTSSLESCCYGDGLFIAVGFGGVLKISDDGITWRDKTSGTTNNLYGSAYGGEYILCGLSKILSFEKYTILE